MLAALEDDLNTSAALAAPGVRAVFEGPRFHEAVIALERPVRGVLDELALRGIVGGYDLSGHYPSLGNAMLVCATETRTVRESQTRPFEIRSPRGPASFQHRVEYEVSYNGYLTEKRVANIEPGQSTTLRGALVAE